MLGVVCLLVLLYFYLYLPETKGRSLEDMSVYFAERTGNTAILDAKKRLHGEVEGALTYTYRYDSISVRTVFLHRNYVILYQLCSKHIKSIIML